MYSLLIATPEQLIFEGEVESLVAPGALGYLEILSHHAPIVTLLNPGTVTVTTAAHEKVVYKITGGILEVHQNRASLLPDDVS
jgi:F-type H+-transporting ATPase subunit epsilon